MDTPKFRNFNTFTCIGDKRSVDIGDVRFEARIEADTDTRPTDFECYSEEDIQAWRDDEWSYCGVVISVWIDGLCIDNFAASLWGIDCNFPGSDNSYLAEVANDLLPEAIEMLDVGACDAEQGDIMSEDKRYNGWTNYETWLANLWLDNDLGSYDYWSERAQEAMQDALDNGLTYDWPDWSYQRQAASTLADEMKESHEEAMDELKLDGFFLDMLRGAMSEIDWREIAQHYTDDIKVHMAEWHSPGCLPESDPAYFFSEEEARNYLAEEMERGEEELSEEEETELQAAMEEVRRSGAAYWRGMNWCVEEVN